MKKMFSNRSTNDEITAELTLKKLKTFPFRRNRLKTKGFQKPTFHWILTDFQLIKIIPNRSINIFVYGKFF